MQEQNRAVQHHPSEILSGLESYWADRSHSYSAQNVAEMNDWRRQVWRDLILSRAPAGELLRVLDVGTGPGFFAMTLALEGHEVTAIDVTEHMLQHAAINARAYGAEISFMLHRGEMLPFEDESFDLIVSRNVVWNLEFPERALEEWGRVLRPGGRMVYFDANWYLYLFDDELRNKRETIQKAFLKEHPDYTGGGNLSQDRVRDLERIAYSLPMSKVRRPEWDSETLQRLGMKIVEIIDDIGMSVTDPSEWKNDTATPMFMICAERP